MSLFWVIYVGLFVLACLFARWSVHKIDQGGPGWR